ncbi:MAG: M1 family aminopeptidase, partial [Gammaproteobacteria bacterium]|nr:M1 family aminopeptidase [Gammaproteobacteria bacterium]
MSERASSDGYPTLGSRMRLEYLFTPIWSIGRCTLLLVLMMSPALLQAQPLIRHEMEIRLQPTNHTIAVEDTITLPETYLSATRGTVHFALHGGLKPESASPDVQVVREQGRSQPAHIGIDTSSFSFSERVPLEHYTVSLPAGQRVFVLKYQGEIHHPLVAQGEEYARSFRETPGTISPQGVYLAGSTYWYPRFSDDLVTFAVDVRLPPTWNAVSQGKRTLHGREQQWMRAGWQSLQPQEEIYLTAGKFTEYSRAAGPIKGMVFLRAPDPGLAKKYLDATAQYIQMYGKLIGPYPYQKFALVENFWQTGYGMPSFTLLGPKVIRFPFILHSSYPHEILHNWWGNGVFVDYQSGNWSEGLTAYLADHLIQEQRGAAVAYRRTALQRYADHVTTGKDFPLTEFRARHSAVTQAVGYDKALMFFHMLRVQLGDDVFTRALQEFYRDRKFQRATFADLRRAFEAIAGRDLQKEFMQWISRPGAPALRVSMATARPDGNGYLLTAAIQQAQAGEGYRLRVPVAVHLEGRDKAYQTTAVMDGKRLELALRTPARPLRLDVDPEFDVFRRLDRSEIPPALSQAFGADRALILLPSAAAHGVRRGYRQLAESWQQGQPEQIEIRSDNEIRELPVDRAVWLFGWENRFRKNMATALADYPVAISDTATGIEGTDFIRGNHSMVINARAPANPAAALTWLATDNIRAMPGLGRKLPHYGKYSYLVFEGDEPVNVAKGQWPVVGSPMSVVVSQADEAAVGKAQGRLAPRRALIEPPVNFSQERMLRDIHWLSRDALRGRGFGMPELHEVAAFVAAEFRQAGLQPAGDHEGSYFQTWTERGGEPEHEVVLKNVVGIIPGGNSQRAGESVVLGAHYDHLGLGWPDVHKNDRG